MGINNMIIIKVYKIMINTTLIKIIEIIMITCNMKISLII